MQIVNTPKYPPGYCIVSGKSQSDDGFIELGQIPGWDPMAYVAISVIQDHAAQLGLVRASEHQPVVDELAAVKAELDETKAELEEFERYKEMVEWTLRSVNKKVERKPGPPKQKTAPKAA